MVLTVNQNLSQVQVTPYAHKEDVTKQPSGYYHHTMDATYKGNIEQKTSTRILLRIKLCLAD